MIYRSEPEKFTAIADEIERLNRWTTVQLKNGDVLSSATFDSEDDKSVELQLPEIEADRDSSRATRSTKCSRRAGPCWSAPCRSKRASGCPACSDKRGIKHEVLNAKHHKREAEIVAQAGRKGAVTIATNMAGRGTDIILGGNPETMAWAQLQDKYATRLDVPQDEWHAARHARSSSARSMKAEGEEVKKLGGLHIIGTERHEARRIDLQLRGRCGRQGDPGSSRFYLSLEDDLMRIFAGEWVKNLLTRLGMQEGEAIESRMVSRRIEGAQKKVEERNFESSQEPARIRRGDGRAAEARLSATASGFWTAINCRDLIIEMIGKQVDEHLARYLEPDLRQPSTFAAAAGNLLHVQLDAKDLPQRRLQRRRADRRRRSQPHGRVAGARRDRGEPARRTRTKANGTGPPWPRRSTPAGASTSATATSRRSAATTYPKS